ncbi:formate dehydrogenase accessory sulfurtransferase FdhD [Ideonella margarita]|uniref:formate dehydrogenase accessory sulfurtransferase FdhD n=1 Tax=Ideonella margarita TaxID=2984191 RepID=UPI003BFA2752
MSELGDPPLPPGVRQAVVSHVRGGRAAAARDWLAEEVPVALVLNGISHAVMMATPDNLEAFALGFGLTEGLLARPAELYGVEVQTVPAGIELHMTVASACAHRLAERRRTLAGRTGCGLCGTDSLAQVRRALPAVVPQQVLPEALARAQQGLRAWQALQQLTGATHAAAWCSPAGEVLCVREDVGRHNALDKLIGALVQQGVCTPVEGGLAAAPGFACITSRASFEMVQKAAMAGIGVLAAVSAPTALAVDVALEAGVLLAGFVRGDDLVAYTYPERLGLAAQATAAAPAPAAPTALNT